MRVSKAALVSIAALALGVAGSCEQARPSWECKVVAADFVGSGIRTTLTPEEIADLNTALQGATATQQVGSGTLKLELFGFNLKCANGKRYDMDVVMAESHFYIADGWEWTCPALDRMSKDLYKECTARASDVMNGSKRTDAALGAREWKPM